MSLRYALIGLLATEPMSGYDLTRRFSESLANVWPAQHSQIYPELARLVSDGMIEQTGEGPRGRKTYATTPAGVAALTEWMSTEPDYDVRCESGLRGFFLWALPADEAIANLHRDAEVYRKHLTHLEQKVDSVDWRDGPGSRSARITAEMGIRYYRMLVDWAEWAAAQIADGALQEDSPPPAGAATRRRSPKKAAAS